jgi:hypothetical protein
VEKGNQREIEKRGRTEKKKEEMKDSQSWKF